MRRKGESGTLQTEVVFADGEYVIRAGDTGTEMYVIQSGQVEVLRPSVGGATTLATLGPGDFFGEMSLLESLPRDADVRAMGTTTLIVINQGDLLVRIRRDPTFAIEMLHKLSARVRALNAALDRSGDEVVG